MDRGAWRGTVRAVAESQTCLSELYTAQGGLGGGEEGTRGKTALGL